MLSFIPINDEHFFSALKLLRNNFIFSLCLTPDNFPCEGKSSRKATHDQCLMVYRHYSRGQFRSLVPMKMLASIGARGAPYTRRLSDRQISHYFSTDIFYIFEVAV